MVSSVTRIKEHGTSRRAGARKLGLRQVALNPSSYYMLVGGRRSSHSLSSGWGTSAAAAAPTTRMVRSVRFISGAGGGQGSFYLWGHLLAY